MDATGLNPEQRQLLVEIEVATKNIDAGGGASEVAYAVSQGRELIEKADKLGLPEDACAALRRGIAARGSGTAG